VAAGGEVVNLASYEHILRSQHFATIDPDGRNSCEPPEAKHSSFGWNVEVSAKPPVHRI
jgi:hypothetical protein